MSIVAMARPAPFSLHILVAEERVVVEIDLGIQADDVVILRHDQRIDLEQAHILGEEGIVKQLDQHTALLGLIAMQIECGRDFKPDEGRVTGGGIHRKGLNLFRRLFRDRFDVHAAFGGGDERHA
jgi:hypothetical protein